MKAAVVHSFDNPLAIEEDPVPEPSHGQVVVKVETSGLCHTELHAPHGDWPVQPTMRCSTRRSPEPASQP